MGGTVSFFFQAEDGIRDRGWLDAGNLAMGQLWCRVFHLSTGAAEAGQRDGLEEQSGKRYEMKQQPTRTVSSVSCLAQTRLRLTRTGGRIGTWRTARRVSGTRSEIGKSRATPPKPRSTTRARWAG